MKEIWKAIKRYDGVYEVSDLGNVRSYNKKGHYNNKLSIKPNILKQSIFKSKYLTEYLTVSLYKKRKKKTTMVAHLVLETFTSPRPEGMQASHLNGIGTDNKLSNLAWESNVDNNNRKYEHGTMRGAHKGEKHSNCKLKDITINEIRKKYNSGKFKQLELCKIYSISPGYLNRVIHNKVRINDK